MTSPGTGGLQSTVALVPALNQATTGACASATASRYWDIGLRGDSGPSNHSSGVSFAPRASILTDAGDYPGGNSSFRANSPSNPNVVRQYCNGSKIPPEAGTSVWYLVPPGTNEGNVPVPIFNLTAGATVDEGNNWISMTWGPLSLTSPISGAVLGDYSLGSGSPAIGYISPATSSTTYAAAPANDFFENPRKNNNAVDVGAVEFVAGNTPAALSVSPTSLAFGSQTINTTSASQTLTLTNSGGATATGINNLTFSGPFSRAASGGTCGTTLAGSNSCTINVVFQPTASGAAAGSLTFGASVPVSGSPVSFTGTGVKLGASPTSLTFLTIFGSGFGAAQNVTVRNNGPAGSGLTGPISVSITGATNGVIFQVSSNNCPAAGLAPGASCTIGVQFRSPTPLNAGTATLNITDTEPAAVTVSLSGLRLL